MKCAVLSGKGGAGKTFTAVNLAYVCKNSVYVDCDVEEPNGRIFLKPQDVKTNSVYTNIPTFNMQKCTGCRKCADFCKFNALLFIKNKPMLFKEVCHDCKGCYIVCPENAISEEKREIGSIEIGSHESTKVVTGILNTGENSGVSIIKEALKTAENMAENVFIDCPPGSACSVTESIKDADVCIITAEPTAFGLDNFRMVCELTRLLNKETKVIINKFSIPYKPLLDFCEENGLEIIAQIPYKNSLAGIISEGNIAAEKEKETENLFKEILHKIGGDTL